MARKFYKFKSSGIRKRENRKIQNQKVVIRPLGIKTPIEFAKEEGDLYKTHSNPASQLKDNLRNLIQTNFGERIGRPEFGANLSSIVFDLSASENFLKEASLRIDNAIKKYIPAIIFKDAIINNSETINSISINPTVSGDSTGLALIELVVTFDIPSLRLQNQKIEVLIYAGG